MADDTGLARKQSAPSAGVTKQERRPAEEAFVGTAVRRPVQATLSLSRLRAIMKGVPEGTGEPDEPVQEVLEPGSKVGRYEVIRLVGEGGMGAVYEALDARLGRKVALKILSSHLKSKRKAAKRFSIEAQAAARLVHPNVVGIFDFDVECEIPYMAMEFLQGETLASAIERGPLAFDHLADIMLAVCAGVHAAHQAGIVHRDLKPSNIFLCMDWRGHETARVLDFGISKVGGVSGSGLTETGDIVGTSQYLSPEQAAGLREVTALCDQYSLGVVIYECVTQQTPQKGLAIHELLRNVTRGCHTPAHELRPDLPAAIESVIERAMSVKAKHRFSSVYELGVALFPFASPDGRRRFEDYYHCPSSETVPPEDATSASTRERAVAGKDAAATPHQSHEPAPAWQRHKTRTSVRPAGQKGRSASDAAAASASSGLASPSRSRKVLYSIVLGALLAVAALGIVGLALRP
jgi:eukaryotic-like serine/threonine-protein kinase